MSKPQKPRRLKIFPIFVLTLVIIAITALRSSYIRSDIAYLEDELQKKRLEQISMEAEISSLEKEIDEAAQDRYVIEVARARYGYLMPGEVRFKVTNIDSVLSAYLNEHTEVAE